MSKKHQSDGTSGNKSSLPNNQKQRNLDSSQHHDHTHLTSSHTGAYYNDYTKEQHTPVQRNPESCGRCELNVQEHKKSIAEMDEHYKALLNKERTALKERDKEFDSFKSRMATDLKNELKTGDCESMDSPVSNTQLTAMYDEVNFIKWPKIKGDLKTKEEDKERTDKLIRGMFDASRKDMDEKKKQLEEMFAFHKYSMSPSPKDVTVYTKLATQNLQMAVYHSSKKEVVKVPFLKYQDDIPEEVAKTFRDLAAECYWLGCLMALNNPPLHPDWNSLKPGPDAWNLFPPKLTSIMEMDIELMEQ